jgi:hypothetical protein
MINVPVRDSIIFTQNNKLMYNTTINTSVSEMNYIIKYGSIPKIIIVGSPNTSGK